MKYRRLGRSALRVSELCLGTMNFGPLTNEDDSRVIMDHALDAGINFFDTANRYGGDKGAGATEEIVGRWLALGGGRRGAAGVGAGLAGGRTPGDVDEGRLGRVTLLLGWRACEERDRTPRGEQSQIVH